MGLLASYLLQTRTPFKEDGNALCFNFTLASETVGVTAEEALAGGRIGCVLTADIRISLSNLSEVRRFLDIVNRGLSEGAFDLNDDHLVVFRVDLLRGGVSPTNEEVTLWLEECHNNYLAFAKVTPFINREDYPALQAFTDLMQMAGHPDFTGTNG